MNTDVLFSSKRMDWSTPQDFFEMLDKEFGFTLDPCASVDNHKCDKYYTKEQDGLKQDWCGETAFVNPPYDRETALWVQKCFKEVYAGGHAVLSCYCLQGRTRHGSIGTYTIERRCDL